MKIKTITCHEVYNHGASLQEYALLKYLENLGHDTETIHYKPDYLSNHFNLWRISNPRYEKNFILKLAYLLIKFPHRLKMLKRKKNFDAFSYKYIKTTKQLYKSNDELKSHLPEADAYICGSDQIWNSFFENGKDPAFYLDFVPDDKLKLSYAASFAIDKIEESLKPFVKEKVSKLNFVSVRETSGLYILKELGIENTSLVLDPVFLLSRQHWSQIAAKEYNDDYIFLYDCDSDPLIKMFIHKLKTEKKIKVFTVNENIKYADKNFNLDGPETFLSLLKNAKFVVSNSFHAVAFSVIFQKQFTVFNRHEKINTRMRDLVNMLDIPEVLIQNQNEALNFNYYIDYKDIDSNLRELIHQSKSYLSSSLFLRSSQTKDV